VKRRLDYQAVREMISEKKGSMERAAYNKRFREFFASDKGMHTCLLRGPSGDGIQC